MSDSTKNLTEIYDDIDLCYKVMGLTFSDPPDRVDKIYNGLIAEYTKNMQSADPAGREVARENLEQTKDLYERITNSMIYKDYAREYEKYKQHKLEEKQALTQKLEDEKESMVACPFCRKLISPKLKVCMYCRRKILSPFELLVQKIFTKNTIIIAVIVLVAIVAGVLFLFRNRLTG